MEFFNLYYFGDPKLEPHLPQVYYRLLIGLNLIYSTGGLGPELYPKLFLPSP